VYERAFHLSSNCYGNDSGTDKTGFSEFATACAPYGDYGRTDRNEPHCQIYFSDSSRTRRDILIRVFKPLLSDSLSASVVSSIFDALRVSDVSYIAQCFGEWVFTLPLDKLLASGLAGLDSPLNRFLQDLASRQLSREGNKGMCVLRGLQQLCHASEDLIRAQLLGVLCRNALEMVLVRQERLTYGEIVTSEIISPWEKLLRKLRLCIVIRIKLKDARLVAPVTVANLEEDGLFSIYELIAIDLLSVSRRFDEIASLQAACSGSSFSFDATSEAGDDVIRIKQLQTAYTVADAEQTEYGTGATSPDRERFGVLLLFLPSYNQPVILAAHRIRLLSREWHKAPQDFELIQEALVTLTYLDEIPGMSRLALAVALDVWHSTLAPIYRARLFGIHGAHEIHEALFGQLLLKRQWCSRLGTISTQLLDLLKNIQWAEDGCDALESVYASSTSWDAWPTARTDHILKGLVEKSKRIEMTALDTHLSIICALKMSDDMECLLKCVPASYTCFLPQSLYARMVDVSDETNAERLSFLTYAVVGQAISSSGPKMESFRLDEIDLLCRLWEGDPRQIHTSFLQCMYELGKDDIVNDFITKDTASFDVPRFIDAGVDIVCMRLHTFLCSELMQTPAMRGTIGILDAELCEWIHQRANVICHLTPRPQWIVAVKLTHRLALRLLGLSTSIRVEPMLRTKIHSLTVSLGTLVNVTANQ
jgi:hypothetical protein